VNAQAPVSIAIFAPRPAAMLAPAPRAEGLLAALREGAMEYSLGSLVFRRRVAQSHIHLASVFAVRVVGTSCARPVLPIAVSSGGRRAIVWHVDVSLQPAPLLPSLDVLDDEVLSRHVLLVLLLCPSIGWYRVVLPDPTP
jgi:hypothetical protein